MSKAVAYCICGKYGKEFNIEKECHNQRIHIISLHGQNVV